MIIKNAIVQIIPNQNVVDHKNSQSQFKFQNQISVAFQYVKGQ